MNDTIIIPALTKWMATLSQHYPIAQPALYRMSQVGKCENALVQDWLLRDKVQEREPNLRASFGSWLHECFTPTLRKAGFNIQLVEREVVIPKLGEVNKQPIQLRGHIDCLLQLPKSGRMIAVDFKFLNDWGFNKNVEALDRMYLWQMTCYLYALKLRQGLVFLVNLSGDFYEAHVMYDQALMLRIRDHLTRVTHLRLKEGDGQREYERDHYPCTYCTHRTACWKMSSAQLKQEHTILQTAGLEGRVRDLARALGSFMRKQEAAEEQAIGAKGRKEDCAIQLLKTTRSKKVTLPGSFTAQWWGKGLRVSKAEM